VDLAQESGANLVIFTLFASTSFLLIVIVALFAGDTVPSEASGPVCVTCWPLVRRSACCGRSPGSDNFLGCRFLFLPA
jgi:ABC-2 type transport system permease protein